MAAALTAALLCAVRGDPLVAPGKVLVELVPLRLRALQRQPRERAEFVARILEHIAQDGLQLARALREHQPELGQQAADAVDAGRAVFLEPSRSRCTHSMLCCSIDLTGTKRIVGREAASQIAAASLASFLPLAPCFGRARPS